MRNKYWKRGLASADPETRKRVATSGGIGRANKYKMIRAERRAQAEQ